MLVDGFTNERPCCKSLLRLFVGMKSQFNCTEIHFTFMWSGRFFEDPKRSEWACDTEAVLWFCCVVLILCSSSSGNLSCSLLGEKSIFTLLLWWSSWASPSWSMLSLFLFFWYKTDTSVSLSSVLSPSKQEAHLPFALASLNLAQRLFNVSVQFEVRMVPFLVPSISLWSCLIKAQTHWFSLSSWVRHWRRWRTPSLGSPGWIRCRKHSRFLLKSSENKHTKGFL